MTQNKNIRVKQCGFSLMEALVAFMILSIGMLGIASLQVLSLKAGRTAELRTVAVIKAEEIMERIRNNPLALQGSGYDSATTDDGQSFNCNDYAGVNYCTSIEMARDDIFQWKNDLKASLRNTSATTASIDVVSASPGVLPAAIVTVTINWQERDEETKNMEDKSYSVTSHVCESTIC